jgi:hypothetical protein
MAFCVCRGLQFLLGHCCYRLYHTEEFLLIFQNLVQSFFLEPFLVFLQ